MIVALCFPAGARGVYLGSEMSAMCRVCSASNVQSYGHRDFHEALRRKIPLS
jgi:hypothetical protein